MDRCSIRVDNAFGPRVASHCRSFDFTILFEQSFFSIAPACVLLALAPSRLYALWKQQRSARCDLLLYVKLTLTSLFIAPRLALVVIGQESAVAAVKTTIAATVLNLAIAILLLPLSWLEHTRTSRPASIICLYLAPSVLVETAEVRTYWLLGREAQAFAACFTLSFGVKSLLLVAELWDKTHSLLADAQERSPEGLAGILNRLFQCWINPLFVKGFRAQFSFDDLYPVDLELHSSTLNTRLQVEWSRCNQGGKYDLLWALCRTFAWSLAKPVLPRALYLALTLTQPHLITQALAFIEHTGLDDSTSIGYGLIAAYALLSIGLAISRAYYWHVQYRFITQIRGALVTAVFGKTLTARRDLLTGSQATTLMSADIERIGNGLQILHELWVDVVLIAAGLWLLYQQIGLSSLTVLAPIIICACLAAYVAGIAAKRQKSWLKAMERRLHETVRMLKSSKSIKMLGLESFVMAGLTRLRDAELQKATHWWVMTCIAIVIGFIPQLLGPVIAFGTAFFTNVQDQYGLNTTELFTALTIISLMTTPLNAVLQNLPEFGAAVACIGRIQAYLRLDDAHDIRKDINNSILSPERTLLGDAFVITDGSFAWKADGAPVIQHITCHIPANKVTLLCGPSGSGKTTLLHTLLGETVALEGSISANRSRIALCSQDPWLTNLSIRATITGDRQQDDVWYQTVVTACDLRKDIDRLSERDDTLIGSAGAKLSGGQRQRLALARALYARPSIVLIDDIFNGLDRSTDERIKKNLFSSNGLLTTVLNPTVVIAAHDSRHLQCSQHVITLSTVGQGCVEGPPVQLDLPPPDLAVDEDTLTTAPSQKGLAASCEDSDSSGKSHDQDRSEKPASDSRTFLWYAKAISLPHCCFLLLEVAVCGTLFRLPTYWAQLWAEAEEGALHKRSTDHYYWGIFTLISFLALLVVFGVVWHLFQYIIPRSGRRIHSTLLRSVLGAKHAAISRSDAGALTNRFSQDILLIDTQLPIAFMNTGIFLAMTVVAYGFIASSSVFILIAGPFLVVVVYCIQKFYLRTSKKIRLFDLEAKAPLYAHFSDALSGLSTIRAFGWESGLRAENNRLLDLSQRPYYLMWCIQRWLTLVLDLLAGGLATMVIGIAVARRSTSSAASLGVALVNLVSLATTLESVIYEYTQMETSLGAVARVQHFEESTPQESNLVPGSSTAIVSEPKGSGLSIDMSNVTASYGSSAQNVLSQLSLNIQAGEKVAIRGRTGSGKSTLLQVMLKMIDITAGRLSIGGMDSAGLSVSKHRRQFNVIPQEPYFPPGSIRDGLSRGEHISDDALWDALAKVGLEEKLRDRDGGIDAEFELSTFSNGEVQLLSLARAILHPTGILLMDESTSSVDLATDEKMHQVIHDVFADQTIVSVTHRPENLRWFSRILTLENGSVSSDATS